MAKSLVEKYEQILASDPASTVFVELAKALIEKGDNQQAIDVCKQGLEHHADSVVGRVLWGKALISLGRPAEAMEQFDKAIAINRDNPHAYNLIGEVLLHKGLYRSALPLLRKAVALQPNDGRVRQWLEQTQAALAGGPAPILSDPTRVDATAQVDKTDVGIAAYTPEGRRITPAEQVAAQVTDPGPVKTPDDLPVFDPASLAPEAPAPAEQPDPFSEVPKRTSTSEQLVGGLTETFNALTQDAPAPAPAPPATDDPFDAVAKRSAARAEEGQRGPTVQLRVESEPNIAVSDELYRDGHAAAEQQQKPRDGLLADVPTAPTELPKKAAPAPAQPARPPPPKLSGGGLLGDIPEFHEPTSSLEVPKVEVSSQAAEAIAREYERELREKLAQSKAKKSFLSRHWLKLSAGGLALVVLVVGAFIYLRTLQINQGSLNDALAEAKKAILEDTRASYGRALDALGRAVRMDEENVTAWALTGYANAVLYSEHGQTPKHRKDAEVALGRRAVREAFPALVQVSGYHLSEGKERQDRSKELVSSNATEAEVNELAGRILLAQGDAQGAVARFQRALSDQPTNVRVLVALGDYYRSSGDYKKALEFYATAREISAAHPGRIIGAAESRLELGEGIEESLAELGTLPDDAQLSEDHQARRLLARGKLLVANGDPVQGADLLKEGAARFKVKAFDFELAQGLANRKAGRMGAAEAALETALKLKPKSEEAREALIRVLVDRDRPREALSTVAADPDSRRISLARGVAYARAGDFKRARTELERTQTDGKFPPEAVLWLAVADSSSGDAARAAEAEKVLEKLLAVTKRARGEVLVALGDIHLHKGELDKAKTRYEEASKEPDDVEGACAYGRLLLKLGFPQLALEPLGKAAGRNDSHSEAQEAYGKALLQLGRVAEAVALAEKWDEAAGSPAGARRLKALAYYQAGRLKDADKAASLAIRAEKDNPDAWRTRAMVNFAQGDSKTAFRDLERANRLDPKDADTFCEIGFAFLRMGVAENAAAAFGAALRENKDAPCGQVGAVYADLPRANRKSAAELEKIAQDSPAAWDKAFAHLTRSRVLLAVGRPKEAKAAAEEAVKLAPWSGPAQLALGLAQVKLKDAAATETLARAAELDPVNGNIRLALADALARGSEADQTKALDEYERFLRIGGDEDDEARVKKALTTLKKRLASR